MKCSVGYFQQFKNSLRHFQAILYTYLILIKKKVVLKTIIMLQQKLSNEKGSILFVIHCFFILYLIYMLHIIIYRRMMKGR